MFFVCQFIIGSVLLKIRTRTLFIHVSLCVFMSLYVSLCLFMYLYSLYVSVCLFMSLYVSLCLFMPLYVCLCLFMSVYASLCLFIISCSIVLLKIITRWNCSCLQWSIDKKLIHYLNTTNFYHNRLTNQSKRTD